jgi:glutamate dehydrogenase/leucine dehydrogenase
MHSLTPPRYGATLNATTAPTIRAQVICGAANNQLEDPKQDYGLTARGVLYCPDFVVNR